LIIDEIINNISAKALLPRKDSWKYLQGGRIYGSTT